MASFRLLTHLGKSWAQERKARHHQAWRNENCLNMKKNIFCCWRLMSKWADEGSARGDSLGILNSDSKYDIHSTFLTYLIFEMLLAIVNSYCSKKDFLLANLVDFSEGSLQTFVNYLRLASAWDVLLHASFLQILQSLTGCTVPVSNDTNCHTE